MFFGFLITFLCHESYITFLLQHPFCGHGYTRAVIQDLLDTYKRKKGDKGNIAGPGDDDDDEDDAAPVDEVRLLRSVMWLLLFPRVVLKKVGCQLKFQVRQCKDTVCYWTIVSTQSQMPVALFFEWLLAKNTAGDCLYLMRWIWLAAGAYQQPWFPISRAFFPSSFSWHHLLSCGAFSSPALAIVCGHQTCTVFPVCARPFKSHDN